MAFWDLHTAWFYGPSALIAEWQSGYQDYANTLSAGSLTQHIRVPVQSYYVTKTRVGHGLVLATHLDDALSEFRRRSQCVSYKLSDSHSARTA
jgi:hypothetical protein